MANAAESLHSLCICLGRHPAAFLREAPAPRSPPTAAVASPLRLHFATQKRLREQRRSSAETFSVSAAPRSFQQALVPPPPLSFFLVSPSQPKGLQCQGKDKKKKKKKSLGMVSSRMFWILFAEVLNRRVAKRSHPTPDPLAKPPFTRTLLSAWILFHIVLLLASAACTAFNRSTQPKRISQLFCRDERREPAGWSFFKLKARLFVQTRAPGMRGRTLKCRLERASETE